MSTPTTNINMLEALASEGKVYLVDRPQVGLYSEEMDPGYRPSWEDILATSALMLVDSDQWERHSQVINLGVEAFIAPTDGTDGYLYEWALSHPVSHPWELSPYPVGVTVYDTIRQYGGPEEGGWYYTRYVPEAVFLADMPNDITPALNAARIWAADQHWADDAFIIDEAALLTRTTVSTPHYC